MYWFQAIDPYVKNAQVFICPSRGTGLCNYGINFDYLGYSWAGYPSRPQDMCRPADIARPAETVMLCDSNTYYSFYWNRSNLFDTNSYNGADPASPSGGAGVRHNEGANYSFCDGHVKWYAISTVRGWGSSMWDRN